jgi:hypothetical protein
MSSTASITTATAIKSHPHPTLAPRQELRTITQTIRLASTTFVTEVTLGGPPRVAGGEPTSVPVPNTRNTGGSSTLTGAELGAILGGVLGFAVIAILLCCCLMSRRRRQQIEQEEEYDDDILDFDHEEPRPQTRPPQHPHRARQHRQFMSMPAPPQPLYEVNRRPPWNPVYSGPRRHLRR